MPSTLFESWERIASLGAALVVAYLWVIVVLRVSGKRTLAKLNAFDFVVTIALGSSLATVVVSREVPIVEGLLALAGLVTLQYVVARAGMRWPALGTAVRSVPTALVVHGDLRHDAMRRSRVRHDELAAALRKHGAGSFEDVDYVVFETDGTLSVLSDVGNGSALDDVDGVDIHDRNDRTGTRHTSRRTP